MKARATLTRTEIEAGAILLRTAVKVVWGRMGGGVRAAWSHMTTTLKPRAI